MKPLQAMPFRPTTGCATMSGCRRSPRSAAAAAAGAAPAGLFPADARLRDDIGLPPLGDGVDAEDARRSPSAR